MWELAVVVYGRLSKVKRASEVYIILLRIRLNPSGSVVEVAVWT